MYIKYISMVKSWIVHLYLNNIYNKYKYKYKYKYKINININKYKYKIK